MQMLDVRCWTPKQWMRNEAKLLQYMTSVSIQSKYVRLVTVQTDDTIGKR